jgi:cobalamin biosynthesis Co2+ chelatase CbiK
MKRTPAKTMFALLLAVVLVLGLAAPALAAAESFAYEGDTFTFIQEDGSPFGMFAPQEGTTVALEGDSIVIHFVPKNTTVYNGIHFGAIDDAELTADVAANADGTFDFRLSADKAGTAFPIAPIKAKDGGTTSSQYYMAVPALTKIAGESISCRATTQALKVDGEVKETEVYSINDANYFKLRDMAMLLNGTAAQFGVDYDKGTRTVSIKTGEAYVPVGGELATGVDQSASALRSTQTVTVDGEDCELIAYNIGGNNFFQLRELGEVLGFYVDYDEAANTMLVYSEPSEEDQAAADAVAALIDAIYVQERNENTDAQCAAAKAAWDALTDAQKELVEGEEADPDYFGRDTGDAGLDDPRNADDIGEKEILVVSFGTSFNGSRVQDIKSIEDALAAAYPEWSVRRAFTAQIIINHIQARDDEKIDNMEQAMDRAVNNGVKTLVIQPTHLMHGAEYDEMMEMVAKYYDKIETILVAEPLLGAVGADASVINADKAAVAEYVTAAAVKDSAFDSLEAADAAKTAFVFMGHGTSHNANVTYSQMQTQMNTLGYKNVFIGTVEGKPASTACEAVIEAVKAGGYTSVILRPLMVVAGDHANNDMADPEDEESWYSMFTAAGLYVETQIAGLGRIDEVQALYVAHTGEAMTGEAAAPAEEAGNASETLADGTYYAKFNTDSSMFKANQYVNGGKSILTVKDGKMTIHVVLVSDSIVNLFLGSKEDAQKEGAVLLQPTEETVSFTDGSPDEVAYAFDIPVEALDTDFACALIGTKGTWYDHTVSVSDVEAMN